MKYEFSNTEYLKAHGKTPRGTGHWAFEIRGEVEGISPETYIDREGFKVTTIFWVPGFLSLAEAKKKAAEMLTAIREGNTMNKGDEFWCWWLSRRLYFKRMTRDNYTFEDICGAQFDLTEEQVGKLERR